MKTFPLSIALFSTLALAAPAFANGGSGGGGSGGGGGGGGSGGGGWGSGNCSGQTGYELAMPEKVAIGEQFLTCVTAPGNSMVLVLISGGKGPIQTKYGQLCVSMPLITIWGFTMPSCGTLCLPHTVECDPAVVGFTGYFQFAAFGPKPGVVGLSNSQALTATSNDCGCGIHEGDLVTYPQKDWGTKCSGNNVGCLRDEHFKTALPGGLLIGDQDGPDGDKYHAALLTDSHAVEKFLSFDGSSKALSKDVTNPTDDEGGSLVAELAAAKLNVAFDDAGAFDSKKDKPAVKLGDLVFVNHVDHKLYGSTVREVIKLADRAASGELKAPIDVDNDGHGDLSLSDLGDALNALNENFDGGSHDDGVLSLP